MQQDDIRVIGRCPAYGLRGDLVGAEAPVSFMVAVEVRIGRCATVVVRLAADEVDSVGIAAGLNKLP